MWEILTVAKIVGGLESELRAVEVVVRKVIGAEVVEVLGRHDCQCI